RRARAWRRASGGRKAQRQTHGEAGAMARRAPDLDLAAHELDQALHDVETEPDAGRRLVVLHALEQLEDAGLRLGRDARPRVLHRDPQLLGLALDGDGDGALARELERVRHQVLADL